MKNKNDQLQRLKELDDWLAWAVRTAETPEELEDLFSRIVEQFKNKEEGS